MQSQGSLPGPLNQIAMKRVANLFLFVSIFSVASAQYATGVKSTVEMTELTKNFRLDHQSLVDYPDNVEGSPYLFESFASGDVFLRDTAFSFHLELNKNGYTGLFEFMQEDKRYAIANEAYDSVVIGGVCYIPVWAYIGERMHGNPMEVLASARDGSFLLKEVKVKYYEEDQAKPMVEAKPARFKAAPPAYYLYLRHAQLIRLKNLKKLDEYDFTPEDYRAFIKKNRISGKDESDLITLFFFLFGSRGESSQ
jgi:hypothetical protein